MCARHSRRAGRDRPDGGGLPERRHTAHLPGGHPRKRGEAPAAQERPVRHCGAGGGGCGAGAHPLRHTGRQDEAVLQGEGRLRRADARRPVRHGEPPRPEDPAGQQAGASGRMGRFGSTVSEANQDRRITWRFVWRRRRASASV